MGAFIGLLCLDGFLPLFAALVAGSAVAVIQGALLAIHDLVQRRQGTIVDRAGLAAQAEDDYHASSLGKPVHCID
ncbi:MAG: hypothetical protein H6707_20120 [Deltaproteobacteria bacterium]|nr:hypothetical protein [Deltaproteobacteria bacterium]